MAEQRQIADNVEDLVPRRLVSPAQLVVDRTALAEDEQIGDARVLAKSGTAELQGFGFQKERAAASDVVGEGLRRDAARVQLAMDRRQRAVVEEVADLESRLASRMQRKRGARLANGKGGFDTPDRPLGGLQAHAGLTQHAHEAKRRAVQAGRLGAVD